MFYAIKRRYSRELKDAELVVGIERCIHSIARSIQRAISNQLCLPTYAYESIYGKVDVMFYGHDGKNDPREKLLTTTRNRKASPGATVAATAQSHIQISDVLVGKCTDSEEVGILTTHALKNRMVELVKEHLRANTIRVAAHGAPDDIVPSYTDLLKTLRSELLNYTCIREPIKSKNAQNSGDHSAIQYTRKYKAGGIAKDDMVMTLCFIALMMDTCVEPAPLDSLAPSAVRAIQTHQRVNTYTLPPSAHINLSRNPHYQ
jgi:hypothetical protein